MANIAVLKVGYTYTSAQSLSRSVDLCSNSSCSGSRLMIRNRSGSSGSNGDLIRVSSRSVGKIKSRSKGKNWSWDRSWSRSG